MTTIQLLENAAKGYYADPGHLISNGGIDHTVAALLEQNAYACVQALTAEARYWDIGKAIGQAYIDSRLGDFANWQEFLKAQMDVLRNPAV